MAVAVRGGCKSTIGGCNKPPTFALLCRGEC